MLRRCQARGQGTLLISQSLSAKNLFSLQDTPLLICFFCARFLSLAFFRIPGIKQQLIAAMALDSRDGATLEKCEELGFKLQTFEEREPTSQEVRNY